MPDLWVPGAAAAVPQSLDDFVDRVHREIERYTRTHAAEKSEVEVELADGSQYTVASMTPEPGFGFFSFTPHGDDGQEPRRVIVPIGYVRAIEVSAPDPERPFGFVVAE